ncbi:hypothetical protein [Streptomyces minutiscleroticus]|uniref:hypothetical protein n=1 Tax=Streptomyces minutiscleroticus TaxID=68238 RepID=UPI0033256963
MSGPWGSTGLPARAGGSASVPMIDTPARVTAACHRSDRRTTPRWGLPGPGSGGLQRSRRGEDAPGAQITESTNGCQRGAPSAPTVVERTVSRCRVPDSASSGSPL